MSVAQYLHTFRYLKPRQVYGRIWHQLRKPSADLRPAPALRYPANRWSFAPVRERSIVGPATFRLLNVTRSVESSKDWNNPEWERLWLYNLHYFDDLSSPAGNIVWQRGLVARWMAENPPAQGTGWEPYPLSLRIVNWIKWALSGNALTETAVQSLAVQARYLNGSIEYHLMGNHLLANAKALIFAGCFFSGEEGAHWLKEGLRILAEEFPGQTLADGGNFERSPMYHAIILQDMLDLWQLSSIYPAALGTDKLPGKGDLQRMMDWLWTMSHPDGDIGFFNDAAFGIAARPAELAVYAEQIGIHFDPHPVQAVTYLESSGYVRLAAGSAVLLFDAAAVGPDFVPAHAHADSLSFELFLRGRRLLVNSGTSAYSGALRARQRATAAHNTLVVDGQDSSEVWADFRVARRARCHDVEVKQGPPHRVSAWHDGYERLRGKIRHRRTCEFTETGLSIQDQLQGEGRHEYVLYFHLGPGIETKLDEGKVELMAGKETMARFTPAPGLDLEMADSFYYPQFGMEVPNRTLVLRGRREFPVDIHCRFEWRA